MNSESKWAFFKQSGWLVVATGICGAFLMFVYPLVSKLKDVSTFYTMLRFFTVFGIFTSGLQSVMAQEAASALTPELQRRLAGNSRSIARGITLFWLFVVLVCVLCRAWLIQTFKMGNFATLAITLGLVLAQLFLPFVSGLLQGAQKFGTLGFSLVLNGLGRFAAIFILLGIFAQNATTALAGALIGLTSAVLVAAWPARTLIFNRSPHSFDWRNWLRRAVPLSAGAGAIIFLMNADVLFVQAHFAKAQTDFYGAVAIVGVGLVTFTTPMAAVMFPKLARSVAQAQRSSSLALALFGTALLGLSGAVVCSVFPSLPLRIMFYNNQRMWVAAQLVPWFMWSMLPLTLANVMVGSLLAKKDFRPVPWFVAIAIGYGIELNRFLQGAANLEMFTAFKGVILRLGVFGAAMLGVAWFFSVVERKPVLNRSN